MAKNITVEGTSTVLKDSFKLFEELFFNILDPNGTERQDFELADFSLLMEPKKDNLELGLYSREYNKYGHFWIRYCDVPDEKADRVVQNVETAYRNGVMSCDDFQCYAEESDKDEC